MLMPITDTTPPSIMQERIEYLTDQNARLTEELIRYEESAMTGRLCFCLAKSYRGLDLADEYRAQRLVETRRLQRDQAHNYPGGCGVKGLPRHRLTVQPKLGLDTCPACKRRRITAGGVFLPHYKGDNATLCPNGGKRVRWSFNQHH